MTIYTSKDGETLDYIVWRHYGKTDGILEQVLTQNRPLAKYGAILPAGIKITLPDIIQDTNKNKIKLWQ